VRERAKDYLRNNVEGRPGIPPDRQGGSGTRPRRSSPCTEGATTPCCRRRQSGARSSRLKAGQLDQRGPGRSVAQRRPSPRSRHRPRGRSRSAPRSAQRISRHYGRP
jgi:hypothetical protein